MLLPDIECLFLKALPFFGALPSGSSFCPADTDNIVWPRIDRYINRR